MKMLGNWCSLVGNIPKDDEGNVNFAPKLKWSINEDRLANYNSKALNAIFNQYL